MPHAPRTLRRALPVSCGLAALASALAVAPAAFAQDATKVGEVIITAQKRSENLQDVPVSVAAISGERLQSIFAAGEDILALSAKPPGLYAESSASLRASTSAASASPTSTWPPLSRCRSSRTKWFSRTSS